MSRFPPLLNIVMCLNDISKPRCGEEKQAFPRLIAGWVCTNELGTMMAAHHITEEPIKRLDRA